MFNKNKLFDLLKDKSFYGYGLLFGVLGAITNIYFNVELYGQLTLHLGQSLVFLCLLTRGFPSALIASVLNSAALWYLIDNPFFFLTLNLEFIVVAYLLRRRMWALNADIFYWVFIGLPITYTILLFAELPTETNYLILAKQILNGVLYTSIALALNYFVPTHFYAKNLQKIHIPLAKIIFRLCVITISLPSLIIALELTQNSVEQFEQRTLNKLSSHGVEIKTLIEQYVVRHQLAVESLATALSNTNEMESKTKITDKYQEIYPGFITMLMTDNQGKITHGAPTSFYQRYLQQPLDKQSVADREYFIQPKLTLTSYISDVFKGRGFGSDMIIAISSPVFVDGRFMGVAEGSLNLPSFAQFERSILQGKREEFILITDSNDKTIYHSFPSKIKPGLFQTQLEERAKAPDSPTLPKSFEVIMTGEKYLFQSVVNAQGWNIYIFQPASVVTNMIASNFYVVLLSLSLIILIFLFLANSVSNRLTSPLLALIEQFRQQEKTIAVDLPVGSPREFEFLTKQIRQAHLLQQGYQKHLTYEVEEKTRQLQELNKELLERAKHDGLTGLLNRKSFDELASHSYQIATREKQSCVVAMLDIDHFKKINDQYGHLTGDECIKVLAKLIRSHFKRSTDIIARFGGEEFIVFITVEAEIAQQKFEALRQEVEKHIFHHEQELFTMTVSTGLFYVNEGYPKSLEPLIKGADDLLYHSKANGRNTITSNMSVELV